MNSYQKQISLLVSLIISCISSILFIVCACLQGISFSWMYLILFILLNFIVIYLLTLLLNNNFVFNKLSQIHESIIRHRNRSNLNNNLSEEEDIIADIQEEINGWADDKKAETDRLKKLELYRKEYIGNVSHELKTPIFNIQGYILTLLDGGLEDKNVNRTYLERAEKSVNRMINIIEDLETISQLETGELIIEQERFDIVALAKDILDGQEMKATSKGIIFSLKNEESVFVFADKFRIRQVLTNLIVNSVIYGKEYGETIIKMMDANDQIKVEVTDNGIGISTEHQPRLFERFYRIDKSRSRDQGGTGLGLAIVKHILEAHKQTIQVSSEAGKGSTFLFTIKKG